MKDVDKFKNLFCYGGELARVGVTCTARGTLDDWRLNASGGSHCRWRLALPAAAHPPAMCRRLC